MNQEFFFLFSRGFFLSFLSRVRDMQPTAAQKKEKRLWLCHLGFWRFIIGFFWFLILCRTLFFITNPQNTAAFKPQMNAMLLQYAF